MIIRHSMAILEQLTEIEQLIQQIEQKIEENGIDIDREKLLLKIIRNREATSTSRQKKNN